MENGLFQLTKAPRVFTANSYMVSNTSACICHGFLLLLSISSDFYFVAALSKIAYASADVHVSYALI